MMRPSFLVRHLKFSQGVLLIYASVTILSGGATGYLFRSS